MIAAAMLISIGIWAQDDTSPVLQVNKESVSVNVTADHPQATATFTYTGKNLTPGTYDIHTGDFPGSAFWSYSPKSVTVGSDGTLNEEISVTFDGEGGGSSVPVSLSITFGLAIDYQSVSTFVVCYFDMDKDYIESSVNIEQLILDYGTSYDVRKVLLNIAMIDYQQYDALDSLSSAAGRNEPFLGMKLKTSLEAMIGGWVKKNDVLRVKFGNIPEAVLVTMDDAAPVEYTNPIYEYNATKDTYIKFSPKGTGSALVIKQIMLNEPIAAVTLPDIASSIDNTETDGKVVKRFENGQLIIIKNGVKYNSMGEIVQ